MPDDRVRCLLGSQGLGLEQEHTALRPRLRGGGRSSPRSRTPEPPAGFLLCCPRSWLESPLSAYEGKAICFLGLCRQKVKHLQGAPCSPTEGVWGLPALSSRKFHDTRFIQSVSMCREPSDHCMASRLASLGRCGRAETQSHIQNPTYRT